METYARVRKVGGSLMVRIPKEIVQEESIHPGELVKIDIQKPRKSGFGMFKGIGPFRHEDRLDTHE